MTIINNQRLWLGIGIEIIFAHIIQHDYVFHPDEWQFEAKLVQQSPKWF
ncbi:hypothetical protein MXL49_10965 [Enterococcus casseliflavus]|jgi:hypothetical protein|nr:hypothetical protein [Enterococcus casseliflavus]MEB6212401.1 hypothetical protein [Enterococcus casseliflavus]